jgi:hypothetical protein
MHSVIIRHVTPLDAVDMKLQLLQAGLVLDRDFSWKFFPNQWDSFSGVVGTRYAEFQFQDPALATFYQLKWS